MDAESVPSVRPAELSQLSAATNGGGSQPYLELKAVSKSFGAHTVLDSVSFAVRRGETVCIMGRSGVGKSVCLQILMGFIKADSGRVVAAGEDITDYSEDRLECIHKKVTIVFQSGALFDSLTRERKCCVRVARSRHAR